MNSRKRYLWKLPGRELQLGDRTLIMAVLNVTPDSFSDGGRYDDPDRAFARAIELEEEGADILDIGAESTRPGAGRVSEDTEMHRLIPVLKRLRGKLTIPVSVDTYKAAVAERALELGAEIINDPSGVTFDPLLARAAANGRAGLVLNHMRGTPATWAKLPPLKDVYAAILPDLEAAVHRATRTGIERTQIVLDPGIGFGKRKGENAEILARLPLLARLDLPILVGPSRKSFLQHIAGADLSHAGAAAVTAAILGGAHILRVHDVKEMRAAARIADAVAEAAVVRPAPAPAVAAGRVRREP